jgi:hypothetical protein
MKDQSESLRSTPTPAAMLYRDVALRASEHTGRWEYYYHEMVRLLQFVIPNDVSVIQLGSGTGDLLAQLPNKIKAGIECVPRLLEVAREKYPSLEILEDDLWHIQTARRFSYGLISEITDSLPDIEVMLKESKKVLTEDGKLVIMTRSFLWSPIFALARKVVLGKTQGPFRNLLRLKDLENMLYLAGFEVIRSGRGILLPMRIPILGWFCNRVLAHLPGFSFFGAVQYVVARPIPEKRRDCAVSIVVAARNEEGNVERLLERVPLIGTRTELIIVEGNSSDRTWEVLERMKQTYKGPLVLHIGKQPGKGKWDAVQKGFSMSTGDLLMILDADMTVPPEDLPRFYEAYAEGRGEFINGSRFIYPMESRAMRFLNNIGNQFFTFFVSRIIRQRLTDTLCGTKVLPRKEYLRLEALRDYLGRLDPFGDFDLIFAAAKLNLRIVELPIQYRDRTFGETQISRFRDGFTLLRMCLYVLVKFWFKR